MDFTDFHFESPWVLVIAIIVGLVVIAGLRWTEQRRLQSLGQFAANNLLGQLIANYSAQRRLLKDILLGTGVICIVAALAGPRWGVEVTQQKTATEDVVFVLDVSKSMLVSDMRPTRLARAKASIANFIKHKGSGNVGLVAFAGQAFLQCPLTRDYDSFFRTLDETDTNSIQVPGTDIGRALEEATFAFAANRNRKLVIILTDGEDLEEGGIESAKQLARKGLIVHTVGVGTASGGHINVISATGSVDTLKDEKGQEVTSRLDEKTLGAIASATGGRYVRLGQSGEGMESLRLAIQSGTDSASTSHRGIPREEWFLALGLILVVCESLVTTRRQLTL
jgi:Ca-activated chloride channel family protein